MRISTLQAAIGSASVLFSAQPVSASLGHRHAHVEYAKRHGHGHDHAHQVEKVANATNVVPRKATCTLPDHPDLVYIPGKDNNGFAMSPDQSCNHGDYCPIACVSGKVMAQWKPGTKYTYPESMYGGLYCNNGKAEKPFENQPYCVDGTGTVKAVNKAGRIVSFCQTVLPGNEAMVIPTDVEDTATLAVPGPDYWANTSAHYYVNPPGISSSIGCVWGAITKALGNWTPFVAGANTTPDGETFVTIAWNPVYLKSPLTNLIPNYGLKIECPDGGCNGVPCAINPSKAGINGLDSPVSTKSNDGANFCTVTVPKGKTANIVVFSTDGSQGGGGNDDSDKPSSSKEPEPPKSTSASKPTTTAPSSSTASPSPSSSSTADSDRPVYGGIFQEQGVRGGSSSTSSHDSASSSLTQKAATTAPPAESSAAAEAPVPSTSSSEGAAAEGGSAIAGLVVALVAAAALF
ncbi:hypothetical protein VTI28DRAFT_829 [Corynascus sepedonium]